MLGSYQVIRRYTPPTCTLEIQAKQLPLSRCFAGRPSFKELKFQLSFDDPRTPEDEQTILKGNRTQLELLSEAVKNYVQNFLRQSIPLGIGSAGLTLLSEQIEDSNEVVTAEGTPSPTVPYLQQKGLLAHRLFPGSLAAELPREYIELSALQLFDLANVLEDYKTELDALPKLALTPKKPTATWAWAGTAAAVILTLGLTTVILREYQQTLSESQTEDSSAPQESEIARSDNVQPVPIVPTAPQAPVPSPTLPPPLATEEQLLPPPPVSLPKPPTVQVSPPQPSSSAAPSREGFSVTPNTSAPPQEPKAPPAKAQTPQPVSPEASAETSDNSNSPDLPILQSRQAASQPESAVLRPARAEPALTAQPRSTDTPTARIPSAYESENNAQGLPSNGSVANESASDESSSKIAANRGINNSIPQVAEAKQYFEQQWQPPETLKQTLEYRLALNQDGSIGRITPLGQASKIYLDRAGVPLLGESFVSPLAQSQANPQIRVVLNPDGTVQTFLEQGNLGDDR